MSKIDLFRIVSGLVNLYEFIILIRILLSYLSVNLYNPVVRWIHRLTDPVMDLVRRYIPCQAGMMDFSPLVIFLILEIFRRAFVTILYSF